MRFSLIIPVYNVKDYLESCVQSVLEQDYHDMEIILVDDGSTDGVCPALCDRLAIEHPDLIRVAHQPNGGLGAARNTGIRLSKGDYLAFLDSDDTLLPGFFRAMQEVIDAFQCDIVDFGMQSVDEHGNVLAVFGGELPSRTPMTLADTPELLMVLPNVVRRVYRRELFFDNDIWYPSRVWYEDLRTTPKLFAVADSIVSVPEPYYAYLAREGSITRNANVDRNAEIIDAFEELRKWFMERGLWDRYRNEFHRLAVDHILLAASVRVLRVNPDHSLLQRFQDYVAEQFPDGDNNPRLASLPRRHKLIMRLLNGKHYKMIKTMFEVKDKL